MLRTALCYRISKSLLPPPSAPASDPNAYAAWRGEALRNSWSNFSDADIDGRDVLDFGCGEGPLSLYLAERARPRSILGVDVDPHTVARANMALEKARQDLPAADIRFVLGDRSGLPVEDRSIDTILAFDCVEHVMDPEAILREWHRVLRPGGKVLIEWFPFRGPYGPHMNGLVPIPWAHIIFGERAMFETAARIYADPAYVPDHWDRDENGRKLPNRWAEFKSFREQDYLNELSIPAFMKMVARSGLAVTRHENRGFGKRGLKRAVGRLLLRLPLAGEYFVNYTLIELQRKP